MKNLFNHVIQIKRKPKEIICLKRIPGIDFILIMATLLCIVCDRQRRRKLFETISRYGPIFGLRILKRFRMIIINY